MSSTYAKAFAKNVKETEERAMKKSELGEFQLPMVATCIIRQKESGEFVAHALDFDLVAVSLDQEEAKRKLKRTVKSYIEFGLRKGWAKHIVHHAPTEFWEPVEQHSPKWESSISIEIDQKSDKPEEKSGNRVLVLMAGLADECRRPALQTSES